MSAQTGLEGLDAKSQQELRNFVEQEQTKARMQSDIHKFTEMCWDKCVTGSVGARFSSKEETCLVNCVDRFLDTSLFLTQQLTQQAGHM